MSRPLLKQLREKHNLTQEQLAEKLEISTVYVRKLENSDANPGRETMLKYERFFNRNMRELFPDIFFNPNDNEFINSNKQVI